jgi:hypothetical protein
MKPTFYERRTWEGRCIADRKELGGAYCGSAPLEVHCEQMRNPTSWVHSSKDYWYNTALKYGSSRKATKEDFGL